MSDDNLDDRLDPDNPPSRADLAFHIIEFDDFKLPFLPLYVDDFLGDVTDLDGREIGAYLLLLMALWRRDCNPLPNDQNRLKRIARISRGWPDVWAAIEHHFEVDENHVYNRRLDQEWRKSAVRSIINRRKGQRGGLRKSLKVIEGGLSPATSPAQASQNTEGGISSDIPLGTTQKPKRRAASAALPEDFSPDMAKARALMAELDLSREEMNYCWQRMKDHAHANDRRQVDWNRAFASWVRKAVNDREVGPNSRSRSRKGSTLDNI